MSFTESVVEDAAVAWLESLGWQIMRGPDIGPEMPAAERTDYGQVVLKQRLRDTLTSLNPHLPAEALDDAFRKLTRADAPSPERNRVARRDSLLLKLVSSEIPIRDVAKLVKAKV